MRTARKFDDIRRSPIIDIADSVRELEKRGVPIIKLETGEPHGTSPRAAIEAVRSALTRDTTHYSHSRGLPELRSCVCEYYNGLYDSALTPDRHVLITPGAKQALLYALMSLVEPGDEVIVPIPAWSSYIDMIRLAGGAPVVAATERARDFEVVPEIINAALSKKTKAIVLNSPSNPTGKIIRKAVLERIYKICLNHDIVLIADEIYDRLVFDGYGFASVLSLSKDLAHCILINGFSKTFAMTGWRLGFTLASPEIIDIMLKIQQNSATCPTTFTQYGAIEAMRSGQEFVQVQRRYYQGNRDRLVKECASMQHIRLLPPEGGLYAFIDISGISSDSRAWSLDFLKRFHVAVTPGIAFGDSAEGFIRVCIGTSGENITEFIKRFKACIGST